MKNVLVIDDEEGLRSVARAALASEGHNVLEAESGETGLGLARTHVPDLILCDVHMQGMDGYAFVEHLRQDTVTSAIPVILMTGVMRDYSSVRHAMGVGADDYLLKPFSVDELLAAVRIRLLKQQTIVQRAETRLSELRTSIALSLPHELRTPLVAILGFAELLKTYYETMDRREIGGMAVDIHKSATRLHSLIENFLIFAQIELMGADENRSRALRQARTEDLQTFVKFLARRQSEEYHRPGDLELDLKEVSAAITAEYFEKIITGLLDNAFKFSESGTKVLVSCASQEGWTTITITDKGRGMTSEQVSNIGGYVQFERKMYEQQGSGLGLIIAKRLLEIHGGSLAIDSRLNAGTVVTAKLPQV
jgi:two-component system, sensor histidine kinase and response regulator